MTAINRLDQIEARANAATQGPWMRLGANDECIVVLSTGEPLDVFNDYTESHDLRSADAEFIANARSDVPALVAALRAVLELHRPVCVYAYAEDCGCGNEDHVIIEDEWGEDLCFDTPTGDVQCAYCRAEQSYVEHPCETVRAIEEALS